MTPTQYLRSLNACQSAIDFAGKYPSLADAYAACSRPDWLFWLAERTGVGRKTIAVAACACARTALPYAKGDAARIAIETTEAWARGEATIDQVHAAAYAVHAADADVAAAAAADAAYAAARAADAAARAAYAAYAAVYAAVYAARAADEGVAAIKIVCDLIRQSIPCPVPS